MLVTGDETERPCLSDVNGQMTLRRVHSIRGGSGEKGCRASTANNCEDKEYALHVRRCTDQQQVCVRLGRARYKGFNAVARETCADVVSKHVTRDGNSCGRAAGRLGNPDP